MKISYSDKSQRKRHYVPLAMGNGKLSFMVDYEGEMKQQKYCGMQPVIVRSGKRYNDQNMNLVRFGNFVQSPEKSGDVLEFSQSIDLDHAYCECNVKYSSGIEIHTKIFCHAEREIIAIRKNIISEGDVPGYKFSYNLPKERSIQIVQQGTDRLEYNSGNHSGFIKMIAPDAEFCSSDHELAITTKNSNVDILLCFDDEAKGENFDTLYKTHCSEWEKYWNESWISIPDEALMKMYRTAQYHLKISSTPWSVPTGLFPSHWEGRFFAYDEFYVHGAFLTSGHFKEAVKIDRFRFSVLENAIQRTCYTHICPKENLAARYPWETREDGSEGSPPGFWMDRYVHMANVAVSAWECWKFLQDRQLLSEVLYPLIHGCAEYYRRSAVYYDSVTGAYIGKCTDMERFGEFIERGYSTTCGGIAVFRAAAEIAEYLDCDHELRQKWKKLSEELTHALPAENERYVPYPGCKQNSIAMYHGIFPYQTVCPKDPLQQKALEETEANIAEFAGQYSGGKNISSWYAGVIATAEIRRGDFRKALKYLKDAAENSTGCFYECFEVYELKKLPWFTTASGALIRAVNELLVSCKKNNIKLWNEDFSFDLPENPTII